MPAISRGSSTRSRLSRQVSEDIIEDGDDPSQHSRPEDVEDAEAEDKQEEEVVEEQQASRIVKKVSKNGKKVSSSKVKKGSRRRGRDDEASGADDDKGEGDEEELEADSALNIDINNFPDYPLSRADQRKIATIAEEWTQIKRNMRTSTFQITEQVAVAMAEAGENKDGEAALEELEQTDLLMRELLDLQADLAAHEDALNAIVNDIARGEEIDNVIQRYTIGVEDRKESWANKTTRQKYAKDDDYIKFKSSIYEVQHPDEGIPPLTSLIPAEEGDDSDDEEIAVGGVSQVYTCPLTLTLLVKPLTSQICNHTFSKASIEEYLNNNRSIKKKCPAAGCSKMVCLSDFKPNPELEKRVQAHQRRERRRQAEADSEDENVEEIID